MTNCTDTLKVFLDTAAAVFAEHGYRHIQTYDIIRRSGRSTASFFSTFAGKGEWGVAVLNARLNQALDQEQEAPKGKLSLALELNLLDTLIYFESCPFRFQVLWRHSSMNAPKRGSSMVNSSLDTTKNHTSIPGWTGATSLSSRDDGSRDGRFHN